MRMRLVVVVAMVILALPSLGKSKGDWSAVRRIDQGRLITIKTPNKVRCTFVDATDDTLFCEEDDGFPLEIDRKHIREVRLELTDEDNAFVNRCIGAGIGIAAGAIASAVHWDSTTFDPIIGLPGAVIGGTGLSRVHFIHGRVIYKR